MIAFNRAFGAILLLAILQLAPDAATLGAMAVHGGRVGEPDGARYAIAAIATIRVPPVSDIEIAGLTPQFDGYTLLQLTDMHISRLFPQAWARGRRPG